MEHDVFLDRAGWANRPRLTCLLCNATLVKQPYMTTGVWIAKLWEFYGAHSDDSLSRYILALEEASRGA